jgi:hypothetical protein
MKEGGVVGVEQKSNKKQRRTTHLSNPRLQILHRIVPHMIKIGVPHHRDVQPRDAQVEFELAEVGARGVGLASALLP